MQCQLGCVSRKFGSGEIKLVSSAFLAPLTLYDFPSSWRMYCAKQISVLMAIGAVSASHPCVGPPSRAMWFAHNTGRLAAIWTFHPSGIGQCVEEDVWFGGADW